MEVEHQRHRLRYDGRAIYDHDAFGRRVQVRQAGNFSVGTNGQLTGNGTIGQVVLHYTYDGLGRVIRTQRAATSAVTPAEGGTLNITDLYYDGVRVVQEVGWSGVAMRAEAGTGGSTMPGLPRRANELVGSGASWGECAPSGGSDWSWADRRLEREYVWAADPGAYVDECVAELVYADAHTAVSGHAAGHDTTAVSLLVLHDHNANVVGLADEDGNIAAQYSWSPYGELRAVEYDPSSLTSAEAVAAAKGNRLGHQGLRMERFDRPWDGALDLSTVVASGTNATGEYRAIASNRNRMYDPGVGRFLEVDPNGLGVPISNMLPNNTIRQLATDIVVDISRHFFSGCNAHSAYHESPTQQTDALGLFTAQDGYAVELEVQEIYRRDHPNDAFSFGKASLSQFGIFLKPDVVNNTRHTFLEVKPLSVSGIAKGAVQMAVYIAAFQSLPPPYKDYLPEASWTPSTHSIITNGKNMVIANVGGIIFYTDAYDNLEDLSVVGVAILARNSYKWARSGAGRILLNQLAGGGAQLEGVLSGVTAAEQGDALVGDVSATWTGISLGF